MNEAFYRQTHHIEGEHWWFVHRRRLVHDLIEARFPSSRPRRGLDVGCGSGGNLATLGRYCDETVGLDRAELPLRLARRAHPGRALVQGDANLLGGHFREESFDLITLFNVLYHRWVHDDEAVLRDAWRLLRPGGLLVLTEAAHPLLLRRHDIVGFGARRYSRAALRGIVEGVGLKVLRESYFNSLALPAAVVASMLDRVTGRLRRPPREGEEVGELQIPPRWLNRGMLSLLKLERRWLRGLGRVPLGVGLIVVAARERQDREPGSSTAS